MFHDLREGIVGGGESVRDALAVLDFVVLPAPLSVPKRPRGGSVANRPAQVRIGFFGHGDVDTRIPIAHGGRAAEETANVPRVESGKVGNLPCKGTVGLNQVIEEVTRAPDVQAVAAGG